VKQNAPVARRYARALHALASEARRAEPVADELVAFEQLLGTERELREALLRPWVKATTKRAIVLEVAARLELSPLTRNFLALVAQRRRLDILGEIIAAYRATVDEAAGRVRARVRSAFAGTPADHAVGPQNQRTLRADAEPRGDRAIDLARVEARRGVEPARIGADEQERTPGQIERRPGRIGGAKPKVRNARTGRRAWCIGIVERTRRNRAVVDHARRAIDRPQFDRRVVEHRRKAVARQR